MSARIILEIPGPPVPKERPRKGRYGNFYTPETTRRYEERIRWAFIEKYGGVHEPWAGPVSMIVKVYMKKPTARPDGSNIIKLIEDALNGLAYRDDAQIVDSRMIKARAVNSRGWVSIHVEEIKP